MKEKARFGVEAAGAGDAGEVGGITPFGACPSCGGDLSIGAAEDPHNGNRLSRVLLHVIPFCDYYGRTSPEQIMADVKAKS